MEPDGIRVDVNTLVTLIGEKDVQIYILRKQLAELSDQLRKLQEVSKELAEEVKGAPKN